MSTQPSIAVVQEEEQTASIALEGEGSEWTVGRSLECALSIPHASVSRRHARIFSHRTTAASTSRTWARRTGRLWQGRG